MNKSQITARINSLDRMIENENRKIINKSGFWQKDQIEKWKIKRYTFIKQKNQIKFDYPEYFL